ncbi:MAG: trehalose-phosphatase [bacterium]|nr:trehalose-phosphatase [bacterium]MDD5756889.1 trehalose-phosphatase [bacterium]
MGGQYYQRIDSIEKGKDMKYFMAWQEWVYARIKGQKIYIFLDYDGTLAPIASQPGLAVLPPKTRTILKKLARQPRCIVAIISGRSLENLRKMIKIPKIIYAGNHGLEVDVQGVRSDFYKDDDFSGLLKKLYASLRQKMKDIKGILIEYKRVTISVHYRLVAGRQQRNVKTIFNKVIKSYQDCRQVVVTKGKMVLEIRPPIRWGKGELVKWLLPEGSRDRKKTAIFYFGDDRTDEGVFRFLKGQGYAIVVGRTNNSAAEYYLKDPAEVRKVLARIGQDLEERP